MYIFKNAWKSIVRSKGRNVLIGIVIVVIAISSCVALSIKNSANEIVKSNKESYDITGTLGIDREALRAKAQSGGQDMRTIMDGASTPTLADITKYADSKYIKSYSYTLNSSLNSTTITAVSNDATGGETNIVQDDRKMPSGGDVVSKFVRGDFNVTGFSSAAAMTNFVSGTYKITSGSMFLDTDTTNACVISDELATANTLKVGSKISFTNPSDETQIYEFTVAGIYTNTAADDETNMNIFSNAANQIVMSYTSLNKIVEASKVNADTALRGQLSSIYNIKDADSVKPLKAELKTKGLNENYTITTNVEGYEESLKPLTNLSNFATVFLILVLVIGGIILIVLNMINIRERKYEVGVLRAIGMKKSKVSLQFISELLIVTFMAITIGSLAGSIISVPTANYMLQNEIATQKTAQSQVDDNFGRPGGGMVRQGGGGPGGMMGGAFNSTQKVDYITQINAVISPMVLLQIALIGILLTLLSSTISIVLISRYEPLKILSNRS